MKNECSTVNHKTIWQYLCHKESFLNKGAFEMSFREYNTFIRFAWIPCPAFNGLGRASF